MNIPIYNANQLARIRGSLRRPWHRNYLAMYSSQWAGIVTDPLLMSIPADDHLVHRGDGVFDAFKCINGRAYCLREHLERLAGSASALELALPREYDRIIDIIKETVRAGGEKDVLVRIFVSRGPGGFSTSPYECPQSQLYVIVLKLSTPPPERYQTGVRIISSGVKPKQTPLAAIKSCDYLQNVLVKKSALDAGMDFAVTWDADGFLADGSTENIMVISPEKVLVVPGSKNQLKGITMTRVSQLARQLVERGLLSDVRTAPVDRKMAESCPEAILTGTSMNVLPIVAWDNRPVGDGRPGPVAKALLELMRHDTLHNDKYLTDMF